MAGLPDLLGTGHYTREEVNRLTRRNEDTGVLTGRYELLEGHLINKVGQDPPHAWSLGRVFELLIRVFGVLRVRNQAPIEVAAVDQRRNEPQPDLAVVLDDKREYAERHPRGDELILIVEVADSSSRFDLSVETALYARAGVPEYWVLDVSRRKLVVHAALEQGTYTQRTEVTEQEYVSIGDSRTLVSDLLP